MKEYTDEYTRLNQLRIEEEEVEPGWRTALICGIAIWAAVIGAVLFVLHFSGLHWPISLVGPCIALGFAIIVAIVRGLSYGINWFISNYIDHYDDDDENTLATQNSDS